MNENWLYAALASFLTAIAFILRPDDRNPRALPAAAYGPDALEARRKLSQQKKR